ncbi:hypothetical protein [Actinacidiphila acididurans]|uniref:Uncharacterized protein n=1 Tax=Actinacidiphila acididurans TaxID=2784346 RepID=A0ABS2TWW7_9ACTN|nr:hypothetical protein [Actinacidiphila acididurans]MBM9506780.1 hypothetical protein [Actinacidiphila acididurans]
MDILRFSGPGAHQVADVRVRIVSVVPTRIRAGVHDVSVQPLDGQGRKVNKFSRFTALRLSNVVEKNMTAVSGRLGIQVCSAWRYFDASALAKRLAGRARAFEQSSAAESAGHTPMPPVGNPELALVLAGVPDSPAQSSGDLRPQPPLPHLADRCPC